MMARRFRAGESDVDNDVPYGPRAPLTPSEADEVSVS